MILHSLLVGAHNVQAISSLLAAVVVSWSWWSAFRLVTGPEGKPVLQPVVSIAGFGRF